jgi:hypothetical protein
VEKQGWCRGVETRFDPEMPRFEAWEIARLHSGFVVQGMVKVKACVIPAHSTHLGTGGVPSQGFRQGLDGTYESGWVLTFQLQVFRSRSTFPMKRVSAARAWIPYGTKPNAGNFSEFSIAMENAASPDKHFTHMDSLTISKYMRI